MNRTALAAVIVALLGAFAALTVSVVDARRPLDREVRASFATVITKAGATPYECVKPRVNFYVCNALVRPIRGGREREVSYTLIVRDSGCWSAEPTLLAQRSLYRELRGCIASA